MEKIQEEWKLLWCLKKFTRRVEPLHMTIPCTSWPDCLKATLWERTGAVMDTTWNVPGKMTHRNKASCPLGSISGSVARRSRRILVPICLALDTELWAPLLKRDLDELEQSSQGGQRLWERLGPMDWAYLMHWWLQGDQLADHSCSRRSYRDDRAKLLSDTAWGMPNTAFVGIHSGHGPSTCSAAQHCSSGAETQGGSTTLGGFAAVAHLTWH